MRNTASWLDDLKIRASWGQTGNQDISSTARYFIYVSNYGINESGGQSYGTSYDIEGTNGGHTLQSGFKRNQIGNDDIKWETTSQTNVGLDFSFFQQTFYGTFDWFYKQTNDILVLMDGISTMGEGGSKWINAGAMDNMGVELTLGYRNQTKGGFKYDITANLSHYKNTVTKLPETVAARGTFGGNGVKSVVGIYSPVPAVMFGANFYFEYKGFDLTLFFQGVGAVDVITDLKKETDIWAGLNIGFLNKGTRLLDAWSPTNPNSDIPAVSLKDNNNEKRVSTYWVEDGSFLKLRNIQLGYNLPKTVCQKMLMENWRFFVSAQNVFTIHSKSFTGVDPENPNFGYPIPLTVTLGTKVTF